MRKLEQKHIDTIKRMVDVHYSWRVGDTQYTPKYEPYTGNLVLYWLSINSGRTTVGRSIELGSELDDDLWNALRIGWYELYTPIEIKDAQRQKNKSNA